MRGHCFAPSPCHAPLAERFFMTARAPSMTDTENNAPGGDNGGGEGGPSFLEAARRAKLARIVELGHDPWGGRFDDRQSIADVRALTDKIRYRKADGAELALPPLETEADRAAFRPWLAEQGAGEMVGPQVRAAGRIVLLARHGQAAVRRHSRHDRADSAVHRQVAGRRRLGAGQVLRPGRHHRRRWRAAADQDGRAVDLRRAAALPDQVARAAAGEAQRTAGSRTAAAAAVSRSDVHRRRAGAVSASHARSWRRSGGRSPIAGSSRSKGRRCTRSPAARRPGRS